MYKKGWAAVSYSEHKPEREYLFGIVRASEVGRLTERERDTRPSPIYKRALEDGNWEKEEEKGKFI